MGTEVPKTHDSSGESDSNSDSQNSSSSESSGSDWECSSAKQTSDAKPHFSVTSCDTGLRLKIAAIPPRKVSPKRSAKPSVKTKPSEVTETQKSKVKKKPTKLSDSSSSSESCSKCSSDSSSDDDLPLKIVSKSLPKCSPQKASKNAKNSTVKSCSDDDKRLSDAIKDIKAAKDKPSASKTNAVKKTKSDETVQATEVKKGRGRPRTKFASQPAESAACSSSTSSSTSASSSSSSSSSSSDSDSAEAAGAAHASPDDSSAALVAACQLQVIDDADLAELFPEQTSSAAAQQPNFPAFAVNATSGDNDDKSIADNGDGSGSEMELTPQLVTAAIQRATADSSGSENECSNSSVGHQNTTHYASSLLQQFVAQTQLLSSNTAPLTPLAAGAAPALGCGLPANPIEGVGTVSDCVLGQINSLSEIAPIEPNFLTPSQHLSPQQTEELSQINQDLEEFTSVSESVGISIPNPPSLEDCVDNNDFMNLDITQGSAVLGNSGDLLKSSPLTVVNSDMNPISHIDSQKLDTISTNSVESQEDVKNVIVESRRKRGRPRKVRDPPNGYRNKGGESHGEGNSELNPINEFHNNNDPPNVSPDSGILSNHNSPTHSPIRRHDNDETHSRQSRKSVQKENNTRERRNMRSKSASRSNARRRSDSSDCDYQKKRIENEIKEIKTEAPSPVPLKQEQNKFERAKKNDHKLDIAALDRMLYATDRVLYPPRKKVGRKPVNKTKSTKSPKATKDKNSQYDSADSEEESAPSNRSVLSGVYAKRKEVNSKLANLPKNNSKTFTNTWRDNQSENEAANDDPLDPTWKEIDLNPKYKDILSGYKSDHEFKPYRSCSRLMESGYKSDYGCRSGYKSDYHRSGYKTDYKSGYKSDKSGYKTDYSVRSMRRRMRKLKKTRSVRDRSYYKNQKHFVSDQEILSLANKTFSSLTLGHSSSDSDCESYLRKPNSSPKYVSVCTKYPLQAKYNFGFSKMNKKHILRVNSSDPFAPGPVFSGLQRPVTTYNIFKVSHNNNNTLLKSPSKSNHTGRHLPVLKPSFSHKFGALPIFTISKSKNASKISPKKLKNSHTQSSHCTKKDNISKQLPNVFEGAKNTYIPNKSLTRNVFLNVKKTQMKPLLHVRKHRRTVVLAPPKINLKVLKPSERPSRITIKTESKHHRHRSRRRHRSRSVSRCRETYTKSIDNIDQKFNHDMDNLISNFIKICQIAPKLITSIGQSPIKSVEKPPPEPVAPPKVVKRGSKKRKTSDNQDTITPTSKRRHKKQLTESQSKGGKDTNEHKLPLKKRHYHINSSTSNSLSLSLVPAEFEENLKSGTNPEQFLCTETDCMGELPKNEQGQSPKSKISQEKGKKNSETIKTVPSTLVDTKSPSSEGATKILKTNVSSVIGSLVVKVDESSPCLSKDHSPNSLTATDDELAIKRPGNEQSELSKKIYETSEKLKAVHKMVHDLEKSLPKSKESDIKTEILKSDTHRISSPRSERKVSPVRQTAPIVTPKKRHRLEADKILSNSTLDQVVQSLSKKLSEDKNTVANISKDVNQNDSKEETKEDRMSESVTPTNEQNSPNSTSVDPLKSMSARSLYKSSIPPAQKSEIMTRKKNRLEGLTSNLVSKINPSAATKVLDTLLNNNIRKSIESRILEKEKVNADPVKVVDDKSRTKEVAQMSTRATVIKSPVSKGKIMDGRKAKVSDLATEQAIVVNIDKPTGIFEPSIDLEDQIPKSSICVSNALGDQSKSKFKSKGSDNPLSPLDTESDIPLALISETEPILRPKRGESIASVLSDKIQETTSSHNLRQPKRNLSNENEDARDKKKKKTNNNIIKESKLSLLSTKLLVPKIQAEKLNMAECMKKMNLPEKKQETCDSDSKTVETLKKKTRRRKAINRTGFPSVKKKKKKIDPNSSQNAVNSDTHLTSEDTDSTTVFDRPHKDASVFDRVPKEGEAMNSFLERTSKKPELKVVLNKDECPRQQARLTVVALEKLQGKVLTENNNKTSGPILTSNSLKKNNSSSILRAPALQLKQSKMDKEHKNHVNKWEVLSETDSIPSLASSLGNDPEDSIPLSLLNLKADRPASQLETLKRKTRAMSPSEEIEEILSKRKNIEKINKVGLRPKSSLAVLYPSERRLTRSSDTPNDEGKNKSKPAENLNTAETAAKAIKPSITTRRKSRSCQMTKKITEVHSSSRESSLDTVVSRKMSSKSREPSLDTMRDHDENDPLPLNEKEIDFEKSIDILSKSIISKKRVASSRDDSPASSVDNRDKPVVSKRNPRLRKKFLAAGLFSDYFKEDRPEGKSKRGSSPGEFGPGLLAPPPYCERWVRRRAQPYALPYDIWWQHHYNQPVPSWNYKKIRTNVYYDVKPSAEECESVACNCAPASGCNEDCINRLVYAECSPQLCPCGERCKNQRIQRHEWAAPLERFMTESKGWGVRTKRRIVSGDFILEYVGEVVSDKEFKERMATRYARDTHHYCLHLDGGLVIDGHRVGGDGRFVNHSCRPNCEMQKWTSNGTFRMALFALRDIDPGEELTYDYNFSLFNPAVGQPCKCDSEDCRGVIGGKYQRITKLPAKTPSRTQSNASNQSQGSNTNQPRVGRPRKAVKCNKKSEQASLTACELKNMTILKYQQHLNKLWQEPQIKPLSAKERSLVKERHCFLFRNLENVRRYRDRLSIAMTPGSPPAPLTPAPPPPAPTPPATTPTTQVTLVNPLELPETMNPDLFLKRLQALRAPKTDAARNIAKAEDNPALTKKERLAIVFKALYDYVVGVTDDKDKPLCTPLLKSKSSAAKDAFDLSRVSSNITAKRYESVAQFDADMNAVFSSVTREHGRMSALGGIAVTLKKEYNSAKAEFIEQLNKILGPDDPLPAGFLQKAKQEEVIMCICGLHVEEGLMVQCGTCGVWQHARCMRVADTRAPHHCHHCPQQSPHSKVEREIPLEEWTEEGHQFYVSLMRGSLQVRQGDTVYVLRDIPIDAARPDVSAGAGAEPGAAKQDSPKTKRPDRKLKNMAKGKGEENAGNKETGVRKHTYQTIGSIPVSELDIFRVERLWKHKDTQERFVYGHHYLRPHETFHEPTRKFFHNEVMRVPLYEAVPIELVMSQCWVMDLNTYCKGRPVGAGEAHVYICELRVDRTARLFTKISRPKYPICTKAYAFDHFPERLKITRTYAPHEVSPEYLKGRAAKNAAPADKSKPAAKEPKKKPLAITYPDKGSVNGTSTRPPREQQKERVNSIARRLLLRGGPRAALDASYLLARRPRPPPRAP